jgi:hypothetical protein
MPSAYAIGSPGVVVSGVVERSTSGVVLAQAISTLFTEHFRHRHGKAYAPFGTYEAVDDEHAVVLAGSDAAEELLPGIAERALAQVRRLTQGNLPAGFLDRITGKMRQAYLDPHHAAGLAARAGHDYLRRKEPGDLEQAIAELDAVNLDSIRQAAASLLDSLMIGVPPVTELPRYLTFCTMPFGPEPLQARARRSRNYPVDRRVLRVSPDAVQLGRGNSWSTLRRDQVEGLICYPDGGRRVIARDGWTIDLEPTLWHGGEAAVNDLDRIVPKGRHLPAAARDVAHVPRPMSLGARMLLGSKSYRAVAMVLAWFVLVLSLLFVTSGAVAVWHLPTWVAPLSFLSIVLVLRRIFG